MPDLQCSQMRDGQGLWGPDCHKLTGRSRNSVDLAGNFVCECCSASKMGCKFVKNLQGGGFFPLPLEGRGQGWGRDRVQGCASKSWSPDPRDLREALQNSEGWRVVPPSLTVDARRPTLSPSRKGEGDRAASHTAEAPFSIGICRHISGKGRDHWELGFAPVISRKCACFRRHRASPDEPKLAAHEASMGPWDLCASMTKFENFHINRHSLWPSSFVHCRRSLHCNLKFSKSDLLQIKISKMQLVDHQRKLML
jgi:hypothetical protein